MASSSSSPDEALVGATIASALEDSRLLQQLLPWIAQGLGIKGEEVTDDADSIVDILAPLGPFLYSLTAH